MAKWLVAIGALVVALGVLLWQLSTTPEPVSPDLAKASKVGSPNSSGEFGEERATRPTRDTNAPSTDDQEPSDPDAEDEIEMLVPGTPEFGHRMDVVVPENFREALAPCYEGGLDGNLKLKLTYQLHIVRGEIYATDVRIAESELNDRKLEDCMVSAVQQLRWTSEDVPDWSEEQDLFVRLRTLKKYESRRMQDEDDYAYEDESEE